MFLFYISFGIFLKNGLNKGVKKIKGGFVGNGMESIPRSKWRIQGK